MSLKLPGAKIGDVMTAEIVEVVAPGDMIASFDGRLIRVLDKAGMGKKVGDKVELVVIRIRPLAFKLAQPNKGRRFSVTV